MLNPLCFWTYERKKNDFVKTSFLSSWTKKPVTRDYIMSHRIKHRKWGSGTNEEFLVAKCWHLFLLAPFHFIRFANAKRKAMTHHFIVVHLIILDIPVIVYVYRMYGMWFWINFICIVLVSAKYQRCNTSEIVSTVSRYVWCTFLSSLHTIFCSEFVVGVLWLPGCLTDCLVSSWPIKIKPC